MPLILTYVDSSRVAPTIDHPYIPIKSIVPLPNINDNP